MGYTNYKTSKTNYLVEYINPSGKETYITIQAKNEVHLAHILIDKGITNILRIFTEQEYSKAANRAIEVEKLIKAIKSVE